MISMELNRVLVNDPKRLLRIMTQLRSDKTRNEIKIGINDLLQWLMSSVNLQYHNIDFEIMNLGTNIPDDIDFVASSNGHRIRIKSWAKTREFELTTGRTPVPGVNHMALVLLHEIGHLLHHTSARQVYYKNIWNALIRHNNIPSPIQLSEISEFFADHFAKQIAMTAVSFGYKDERFV